MKGGMPNRAISEPEVAPMAVPSATPASIAVDDHCVGRERGLLGQDGGDDSDQCDHRTDRQVDPASDHDEGHPNRENAVNRDLERDVDEVGQGQKAGRKQGKYDAFHEHGGEYGDLGRAQSVAHFHLDLSWRSILPWQWRGAVPG